jgi:hypothetical protein
MPIEWICTFVDWLLFGPVLLAANAPTLADIIILATALFC